jgi:hypothetical protein
MKYVCRMTFAKVEWKKGRQRESGKKMRRVFNFLNLRDDSSPVGCCPPSPLPRHMLQTSNFKHKQQNWLKITLASLSLSAKIVSYQQGGGASEPRSRNIKKGIDSAFLCGACFSINTATRFAAVHIFHGCLCHLKTDNWRKSSITWELRKK